MRPWRARPPSAPRTYKWHGCLPQGGLHAATPALRAQQAALSPMLKAREQTPLTEGRSSGGTREKPSRL